MIELKEIKFVNLLIFRAKSGTSTNNNYRFSKKNTYFLIGGNMYGQKGENLSGVCRYYVS